jgi:diaminopimelate decarboxylase
LGCTSLARRGRTVSNGQKVQRPAVVFVREGEARVVVKRETYEDLLRNEVL